MLNRQKFISDFLTFTGIVSPQQLEQTIHLQKQNHTNIRSILKQLNIIEQEDISELIIEQLGLTFFELTADMPDPELAKEMDAALAYKFRIFPLKLENEILHLAVDDPLSFLSLEYFSSILGHAIDAELITKTAMDKVLVRFYPEKKPDADLTIKDVQANGTVVDAEAPVIKLVNAIIAEAYRKRASDIHIEPMCDKLRIRYRIDGFLQEIPSPAKNLQASIISRVKLMSGMNIAEKRLPQDGRIRFQIDNKEFDLRISTLPSQYGESVVLRILDRRLMTLDELGFSTEQLDEFRKLINLPNGIMLVTGPTGSGKSTTLYAALNSLNRSAKKILTVEDPVEYQISGIDQVQVKPKIGLSFSRVLRSMLRQAPDIIMVGEIRDLETASIAVQSALTGHLIFSTLHTNDAASAITRLIDMGIKPYLVTATLQAVLAQRLIRLLCPHCKQPYQPPKDELRILDFKAEDYRQTLLYQATGCSQCAHTGYLGRTGIFELLVVNEEIRQLTYKHVPSTVIKEKTRARGMMTLREHARNKVVDGLTSFTELVRITQSDID